MHFLINCSNLNAGGGLQVADSICRQLFRFPEHYFIVVTSSKMKNVKDTISSFKNVKVIEYDIKNRLGTLVCGRDQFLDGVIEEYIIDAVLTIFGPSRWEPRTPHLCGFAMYHLLSSDKQWINKLTFLERIKMRLRITVWRFYFKRGEKTYWTENPYVSNQLKSLLNNKKVYTISNYYNQIFDNKEKWQKNIKLPSFEGTTLLTISTPYSHKNFDIAIDAASHLSSQHPHFKFRFVMTATVHEMKNIPSELKNKFVLIGKINISQCPFLYEQSDIMFMPSLLECFTATYPEAMRMSLPIITTDLQFAHGICKDAACYYNATDSQDCADAIFRVATDKEYANSLILKGHEQLLSFDSYEQRAKKIINILEEISSSNKRIQKKNIT